MGRMKDKYMEYLEKVEEEAECMRNDGEYCPNVAMFNAAMIINNPRSKNDHELVELIQLFNLESKVEKIKQLAKDLMPHLTDSEWNHTLEIMRGMKGYEWMYAEV